MLHFPLSSFTPKFIARSIQSVSPPYFLKIRFNISPHLRLSLIDWIFPSGVTHKHPVCILPLPHTCYTSCSSQSSWVNHSNDILWEGSTALPYEVYSTPLLPLSLRNEHKISLHKSTADLHVLQRLELSSPGLSQHAYYMRVNSWPHMVGRVITVNNTTRSF